MARGFKDWLRSEPIKGDAQLLLEGKAYSAIGWQAGAAAKYAMFSLYNAAVNNIIVRLTRIYINSTNSATFHIGHTAQIGGNVVNDLGNRYITGPAPNLAIYSGTFGAITMDVIANVSVFNSEGREFNGCDFLIPPGEVLGIMDTNLVDSAYVGLGWYELTDY